MKTITSVLVLLLFVGAAGAEVITLVQSARTEGIYDIYTFEFVTDLPRHVIGMSGKFTGQFEQVIALPFVPETPNMEWAGSLDLTYDTHFDHVDADVSPVGDEYETATELGAAAGVSGPPGDPIQSSLVLTADDGIPPAEFGNIRGQLVQLSVQPGGPAAGSPTPPPSVYAFVASGGDRFEFNEQFDPVPEPATMGVLALGSLGMLIRRRRR